MNIARSGLAHVQHCAPGHRPLAELLVRWHSEEDSRKLARRPTPAATSAARATARRWLSLLNAITVSPAAVRALAGTALDWQAADPADVAEAEAVGELALGQARFWRAAREDAEWLDLAVSLHHAGRWRLLRPRLAEDTPDRAGGWRIPLHLDPEDQLTLAADGIEHAAVVPAFAAAVWVARIDGLGVFVHGLVDAGWSLPTGS